MFTCLYDVYIECNYEQFSIPKCLAKQINFNIVQNRDL